MKAIGMTLEAPRTLPRLFQDSVARFGANILLWEKRGQTFEGTTYRAVADRVYECAAGLMASGLKKGERVALIAEGRNDWVVSELGVLFTGAINVPISVKLDERSDLRFRLAHSGCRMVFVSGAHANKVREIRQQLSEMILLVLLDGEPQQEGEITLTALCSAGRTFLELNQPAFEERWTTIQEGDPANICYTSGTTADPKGIVLTHRNYTANVEQASALLPITESDVSLLILPWDHAFAHTAGIYNLMRNGASMASVQVGKSPMDTLRNVSLNIRETKPTFLLSVPALAQNFRKNIEKGMRDGGPFVQSLFRRALILGYAINGNGLDRGQHGSFLEKWEYRLLNAVLLRKIRQGFGGRLQFFIGGGALLDLELQRFFYAIGIPMFQGYGLTEAAPIISANVPARHKLGSSGSIVPGLEVRICDEVGTSLPIGTQGEIVVRGENVMSGYWQNEKATSDALRDGWLFTGDLGFMDADGFLHVRGRVKSLLIGHDGEKYSPEGIEEAILANSPYIDQIMLHNNQSPYTVALVVPNGEAIRRFLQNQHLVMASDEGQSAILRLLAEEVAAHRSGGRLGGEFPDRWVPAAIAILGEGFTEQNGLINSTLKMVRDRIANRYRDELNFLFTPEGKPISNPSNRKVVDRMLNDLNFY